jgi:hypothetical protein
MKMNWTEWAALTALVSAAGVAVYAAMARVIQRAMTEKQQETDRRLSALAATVSALQVRVAELGGLQLQQAESANKATKPEDLAGEKLGAPEAETVAVLTAAATTFLGKRARVRSAQIVTAEPNSAGTWAQQGRASVQTSHNPRSR